MTTSGGSTTVSPPRDVADQWFDAVTRLFARTRRLRLDVAAATAQEELRPALAPLRTYPDAPDLHLSAQRYVTWRLRHGPALRAHGDAPLAGMIHNADLVVMLLFSELCQPSDAERLAMAGPEPIWRCGHCRNLGCNDCVTDAELPPSHSRRSFHP